jgi:hypothetical protein
VAAVYMRVHCVHVCVVVCDVCICAYLVVCHSWHVQNMGRPVGAKRRRRWTWLPPFSPPARCGTKTSVSGRGTCTARSRQNLKGNPVACVTQGERHGQACSGEESQHPTEHWQACGVHSAPYPGLVPILVDRICHRLWSLGLLPARGVSENRAGQLECAHGGSAL